MDGWSYDAPRREWRPGTLRARAALRAIDAAYSLKSRSYRLYCQLARSPALGRIYVHAPFETLYSVVYRLLRGTAFPAIGSRPS